MKHTSWLWVILTVVVMIAPCLSGLQDAMAQGTGPSFRGPGAVIVERSGTLAVVDRTGDAVFRVLPNTGDRSVVSDDNTGSGPSLSDPLDIDIQADGTFVVIDQNLDGVVRIDPDTGDRTVISGCPLVSDPCPFSLIGGGPPFGDLVSVAVENGGTLIVVDAEAKAVLRVTPSTGDRTILSDASRGSGPVLDEPMGVAIQSDGTLALIDTALDAVVQIDPFTGDRSILSGCSELSDPCPVPLIGDGLPFLRPTDLAVRSNRTLVVLDVDRGAIIEVNPISRNRSIVSDADTGDGPVFLEPLSIAVDRNRRLFVADRARNAILQVNPASGDRVIGSQAPSLGISPPTGVYTNLQAFDLALILEGAIDSISTLSATLNVTEDVSSVLERCGIEQRLTGSGLVMRCANAGFLFGLTPGRYRFDVRLDANVASGDNVKLRDTVFWHILGESEDD